LRVLELSQKRIVISGQWDTTLDKIRAMLAAGASPYRADLDGLLRDADGMLNAVRAAGWRFFATGEGDQKDIIARSSGPVSEGLKKARDLAADKALLEKIEGLEPLAKQFIAATNEAIDADALK